MAESKSTPPVWREALNVSMVLFIPAFLLMIGGFFLLNPSLVNYFSDKGKAKIEDEIRLQITQEVKKQLQDETKKQIEAEWKNILASQKALLKLDQESPLGRTYVSREITIQAEEQAKKVAKEELSQAKGDLFGQITFPVIFAIASIFAAFAVKDILTEILKKEEKDKVMADIKFDVEKSLATSIGITGKDEPTGLLKEFKTKLEEYAETKVNGKIKDLKEQELNKIEQELRQFKETARKVDEIEYEVADLTASRMSENEEYHTFLLSTYQRPLSIIKKLSDNEPTDERLKLSHEYQLEMIEQIIRNENKRVASSEDEQNSFRKELSAAMSNFFEVRMAQFYVLLENLIHEAGDDKGEIEKFNRKIQEIEKLSIPLSGIIKKIRNKSKNSDYNNEIRDEVMQGFPGETPLPPMPEVSSSTTEASQS